MTGLQQLHDFGGYPRWVGQIDVVIANEFHLLAYHQPRGQRAARALGADPDEILPRVHRVISNLKNWLQGTHRGVSGEHLQVYLDECTFRFNRRRTPMAAFQTLLGIQSQQQTTTYRQITAVGSQRRPRLS